MISESQIIIWHLSKYGAKRGYGLPKEELREFVPYSDSKMLKALQIWHREKRQEEEQKERESHFDGYQINHELLSHGASDALFMHCLPAHRGEEVSAELMEDPDSVVWQEAENRLHAQKALMEFLLLQS